MWLIISAALMCVVNAVTVNVIRKMKKKKKNVVNKLNVYLINSMFIYERRDGMIGFLFFVTFVTAQLCAKVNSFVRIIIIIT
jgi:hypothetical protein